MSTRRRKTPQGGALVLTARDPALAQLDALAAQAPARAAKPRRKRSGPTPEGRIKAAIIDALALRSR